MFWFLDGFQNSFRLMRGRTALIVEETLQSGEIDKLDTKYFYRRISYSQFSSFERIGALFEALLLRETVVVFYLALAAATLAFVSL